MMDKFEYLNEINNNTLLSSKARGKLFVFDLDNTLYDWVGYFVPAFYSMLDVAVQIIGCDRDELLDDFREVHRRFHDSEHPFSLLETNVVKKRYAGLTRGEIAKKLDPAFYAFNVQRKKNLQLYPGVIDVLSGLERNGHLIVAHTESRLFAVVDRLRRLNIDKYFKAIYCRERPRSLHPNPDAAARFFRDFDLRKVRELAKHQRKPSRDVLLEICEREGIDPIYGVYIGDSLARDMYMAKMAGLLSVWAKYGTNHQNDLYEKLVRISHWTEEDIERETYLRQVSKNINPDIVLDDRLSEIFDYPRIMSTT